jgi:CDP-diacylglycerol---glycerol-3-phosphate 3-phosphatidyltransferase
VNGAPKAPRAPRVPRYPTSALMTPANGVTMLRMAITPVVLMYIARREYDLPTFLLWWVLCGTDGIDGMLARRFGVTSSGAFLDPLADKFLILGALIVLVVKGAFWWPWVAVIALREVGISVYRSRIARRGISLPARKSAKWKTVVQQFAVGFACLPWVGREWPWLAEGTLVLATALTLYSGWLYFADARRGVVRPAGAGVAPR